MTRDDQQKVSSSNAELFDEIRKYLTINQVQRVQFSKLEKIVRELFQDISYLCCAKTQQTSFIKTIFM